MPLHQAAKSVANTTAAGVAISAIAAHPIMRRRPAIFSQLFTRLGGPIHKITTAMGSSSMMLVRAPDAEPMWSYGDRLLASRFYLKPGKRIAS